MNVSLVDRAVACMHRELYLSLDAFDGIRCTLAYELPSQDLGAHKHQLASLAFLLGNCAHDAG